MHGCTGQVLLCRRLCAVTQGLLALTTLCVLCCSALCVLCCTISPLCAVLHCLVLCTALHCVRRTRRTSNTLPHCPGAVGGRTPAMHRHTACGQLAVDLLQCTATLPRGSGQWNSCILLPHCLPGGGGGATPRVLGRQLPPPPPRLGPFGQRLVAQGVALRRPWAPKSPHAP